MSKLTGAPQIFDLNPYEQTNAQQHQLGALGVASNGDCYRYTRIKDDASDLIAGYLMVGLAREDNHQDQTVAVSGVIGDKKVIMDVGATAVDANEYDEGWLIFNDNVPEGETYSITSHEANAGSLETDIFISPALISATVADSSEVTLVRNTWNNPAISSLITEPAAGVAIVDWDVSVANFGWLKTRGMNAVLCDQSATTVGYKVAISNQDAGAVGATAGDQTEVVIGQAMDAGVSGEFNPVNLLID